jgi:hypothetical protein
MAIRCMPVDAKHFPIVRSGSTCGGTLSEKKTVFFYGNHFEETRIWIQFSANADSEHLLTKTKKELRQSPTVSNEKINFLLKTMYCVV